MTGATKNTLRKENKQKRVTAQRQQQKTSYWSTYGGKGKPPVGERKRPPNYKGQMCPAGLALEHPAGELLMEYAMEGCPVNVGRDWTIEEITAAVERGPHKSALGKEQMAQYQNKVVDKV